MVDPITYEGRNPIGLLCVCVCVCESKSPKSYFIYNFLLNLNLTNPTLESCDINMMIIYARF